MSRIDMEQFGAFITQMRKEKGMTQRELAEKLFISDKAVSKWERGLSLPDVSSLQPLAEELGVTVTELLQGKRVENRVYTREEAENLVSDLIAMMKRGTGASREEKKGVRRKRIALYLLEVVLVALELICLLHWVPISNITRDLLVAELLPLLFGICFFFSIKEELPYYYDIDKISSYSDGIFRMNIPGVSFNNRNWPHILRAGRAFCFITPLMYPVIYLLLALILEAAGCEKWIAMINLPICLLVVLGGLFIPMIFVAKKYE